MVWARSRAGRPPIACAPLSTKRLVCTPNSTLNCILTVRALHSNLRLPSAGRPSHSRAASHPRLGSLFCTSFSTSSASRTVSSRADRLHPHTRPSTGPSTGPSTSTDSCPQDCDTVSAFAKTLSCQSSPAAFDGPAAFDEPAASSPTGSGSAVSATPTATATASAATGTSTASAATVTGAAAATATTGATPTSGPEPTLDAASTADPAASGPRRSKKGPPPVWKSYLALTKPRLTALVVLSAMSSYALTPNDATVAQLVFLTLGTALSSGAANAINMGRELVFDGLMTRTRTRPTCRGFVDPRNAYRFAGVSGTLGVTALYFGVNPVVAGLGLANIVLYSWMYTSLKRKHIINTWVGALVGAIPPLMGWASSSSLADPGAWLLAGLLFAWQFPHFNALSHNIRQEYYGAGYVMAAWNNPALNARVSLRYSALMFPLCIGLSYFGVTDNLFALDSSLLNGWLTWLAYKFWQQQRHVKGPLKYGSPAATVGSPYARKLFWGSVLHLPGILVLAMLHKKGHWDRFFGGDDDFESDNESVDDFDQSVDESVYESVDESHQESDPSSPSPASTSAIAAGSPTAGSPTADSPTAATPLSRPLDKIEEEQNVNICI